jgi:hypothetical protein
LCITSFFSNFDRESSCLELSCENTTANLF